MVFVGKEEGKAVLFNYLVSNRYDAGSKLPVRLEGLDATRSYRISEINRYPGTSTPIDSEGIYTGDFLMNIGVNPQVRKGRESVILLVEAQ